MGSRGLGLGERRTVMVAAAEAMVGLEGSIHEASDAELAQVMGEADAVVARAAAVRVVVAAEAVRRGVVAAGDVNAGGWVRAFAPSLRQGGAGQVAALASLVAGVGRSVGSLAPDAAAVPDPASPLGVVWAGVRDARVSPGLALAVLGEVARLEPKLVAEAVPTVTRALVDLGTQWGAAQMRRLRPSLLARYGVQGEFDDLQDRLALVARLSTPFVESADLTHYQLLMTPEQAAALEAAIGPLSAPAPNEQSGERDLRPAGQRRVEALAEVCRRSSGLDADTKGGEGAAGSACAVHVIIALADLQAATGCGEVVGSTATGTLLSAQVLRRICCEADLIPHVLGTAGEYLDLGRVVRLFTRAQRRRLWRRDRCCTYPGCTAPAAWCRAHHVLHWVDGGASDIDNAALLCQQHHTVVHTKRLFAHVRLKPDGQGRYVVWDLHVGSYDRHLERLHAERSANDPPPLTGARLLELAAALTSDDPDERRLAEHDLTLSAEAHHYAEVEPQNGGWHPDDPQYRAWQEAYIASTEATTDDAA